MKSLKDIKEALNKLPDEKLDKFFISHQLWLEDPETKLGAVWVSDDDDILSDMYDMDGYEVIKQFVDDLNHDCMICATAKLDESLIESYGESVPEKD